MKVELAGCDRSLVSDPRRPALAWAMTASSSGAGKQPSVNDGFEVDSLDSC